MEARSAKPQTTIRFDDSATKTPRSQMLKQKSASTVDLPSTGLRKSSSSEPTEKSFLRHNLSRLNLRSDKSDKAEKAGNEETDIFDILAEGSPVAPKTPAKTPTTPKFEGADLKSGMRKMSGLFKPKSALSKAINDTSDPLNLLPPTTLEKIVEMDRPELVSSKPSSFFDPTTDILPGTQTAYCAKLSYLRLQPR
jgi:hypothetical protein